MSEDILAIRLGQRFFVENQIKQYRKADKIRCDCKKSFPILEMYKCLYCSAYFCLSCAEDHFGETRIEADVKRGYAYFVVTEIL